MLSFLFMLINKTLPFNNMKTRTAMNTKISVFAICVEVIIYLLLCNLHDCTFKNTSIQMFSSEYCEIFKNSFFPVGTQYCGDIGFLLDLHCDVDRLRIEIEVTSLYDISLQHHNDIVAITYCSVKLHVIVIPTSMSYRYQIKMKMLLIMVNTLFHFFNRNTLINFKVTLFTGRELKWAISFKYQLHLYLLQIQNFDFQDFLGSPYID